MLMRARRRWPISSVLTLLCCQLAMANRFPTIQSNCSACASIAKEIRVSMLISIIAKGRWHTLIILTMQIRMQKAVPRGHIELSNASPRKKKDLGRIVGYK